METLNTLGRPTTRLGFGGSHLGSTAPAESRRLLSAAFDAGIRHFDVAPMYGFGRSEDLLREALGTRIREITITTKYGLAPPAQSSWIAPVHRVARAALSRFPALRRRLRARVAGVAEQDGSPPLRAAEAAVSLDSSLKRLGIERIDLFLLHEATPARLVDEGLLEMLERAILQGKIAKFGVGSRQDRAADCLRERPAYCPILQYEWSVFSADPAGLGRVPHINHGSLGEPRMAFLDWLDRDSNRRDRWSRNVGADLGQPGIVNRLLLKAALSRQPQSIVLFSTRTVANILSNVETMEDDSLLAPARALHYCVQKEYLPSALEKTKAN